MIAEVASTTVTVPAARPTLLFFWDYDTQWGGDRSRAGSGPKQWGHAEFENTERLLDLHREFGIPACFAVVGAAAFPGQRPYHDPAQIREIHAAGHEVASHSLRHEWLPGLDRRALRDAVQRSKDALEQCIGAEVLSFVPPYNQPFDYPMGLSFSLSERREAGPERTDLPRLCETLRDAGYRFCRVAYRPLTVRLADYVLRRSLHRPAELETIRDIRCLRLNTPVGFGLQSRVLIEKHLHHPGIWVLHGHPHSVSEEGSPQSLGEFRALLEDVAQWQLEGRVRCSLPAALVRKEGEL